jgi:hypothetical protein
LSIFAFSLDGHGWNENASDPSDPPGSPKLAYHGR